MVFGNHGIIDQGSWKNIKIKAASIAKFFSGNGPKGNPTVLAQFAQLNARIQAKDEAEIDLARRSGDTALYRKLTLYRTHLAILLTLAQGII